MHALKAFPEAQNAYSAPAMNTATKRPCGPATPLASSPADVWRSSSQTLPSTGNGPLMLPSSWAQKFTGARHHTADTTAAQWREIQWNNPTLLLRAA